ncbi:MAG: DUF6734 family protein [Bacteroidota bacterium]
MKIIQSFWSKPAFHSIQSYANARKLGGWLNFKYFLISAAYSCLTLRKHHKKVYLYTDTQGSGLMGDLLDLPFEDISLSLNTLDNEDHRLWIRGKMHAIEQQTGPFIHVDNDIYIWEPLPVKPDIILQSRIPMWAEYKLSLNEIFANFKYIPECLKERPTEKTTVANVGIIGGHDMDLFQRFCEESRKLLEHNREFLPLVGLGGFNQMMEEYLFTSMVRHEKKDAYYLLENLKTDFRITNVEFNLVPLVFKYIHLIGNNKQSPYACEQLELRLKYEFPEYHARVLEVLNGLGVEDTELRNDEVRRDRLMKSLQIFYRNSLEEIRNMKIRIRPEAEVIRVDDYLTSSRIYVVREPDNPQMCLLPSQGWEGLTPWLDDTGRKLHKAFTINELIAGNDLQGFNETILINSIAFNLTQTGLMEFA